VSRSVYSLRCDEECGSVDEMQDLQLPPAFCLSQTQLVARAIELAYERDFSHIPYVSYYIVYPPALDIDRHGLTQYTLACTCANTFYSMRYI